MEDHLSIDIRYVDKFILTTFHTNPTQADHYGVIF